MRVDTGSPPSGTGLGDLDARAQLKRYLGAFRRSWYLIAVLALVGAGLGWLSAPDAEASVSTGPTYHRATHTLLQQTTQGQGTGSNSPAAASLTQTAYLVGTGELPSRVATEVGIEVDEVEGSLVAVPRPTVSSIEIQAIGTDAQLVVKLADTAAELLLEELQAQATEVYEAQRDETVLKLARLDDEINAVNLRIAGGTEAELPQLKAQQQSLANQYSLAYEQFTQLANQPPPTSGLVSLEGATSVDISEREFDKAQQEIREGLPYVTGAPTTTTPSSGGGGGGDDASGASAPARAALGGVVGIGLAMGLILGLNRFDNRLRHRDDVEAATGLAVLAEIPPLSRHQQNALEVVAHTQHRSRAAEAYRVVRSALLFAVASDEEESPRPEGEALVVMVTSANPEEGKTTTVANLASVLAEGGYSVLVINCDFRRPRVHKYLLEQSGGDSKANGGADNPSSVVIANTMVDRVKLVTGVGENDPNANPLDVVALQRKIIQTARSRYDVIVLDTAPFLTTNDASELLGEVDQVVLVVRAGKTRRQAAARTAEVLERFEAPVIGVVLNDSDESPAAQYYYSYYLDNGRKKKRTDGSSAPSRTNGEAPAGPAGNGAAYPGPEVTPTNGRSRPPDLTPVEPERSRFRRS